MDKSFVAMEQRRCFVCGTDYDTVSLLFHKRMMAKFNRYEVTGYGTCPECQKHIDDGYVHMIEVDPEKSPNEKEMFRTGRVCRIHKNAFPNLFNQEVPKDGIAYLSVEVLEKLIENMELTENEEG